MKFRLNIQWKLVLYDFLIFAASFFVVYFFTSASNHIEFEEIFPQFVLSCLIIFVLRFLFKIYRHIWRYEGISGYILLMFSDFCAILVNFILQRFVPYSRMAPTLFVVIGAINLIICLFIRMIYRYIYKNGIDSTKLGKVYNVILKIFAGKDVGLSTSSKIKKTKVAIIGAGRTGNALATSLVSNPASIYKPMMFIDTDKSKTGKIVSSLRVYYPGRDTYAMLRSLNINEVIVAIPELHKDDREALFDNYKKLKCKVKMYDYSTALPASSKNQIRDFDIEDLMKRKIKHFDNSSFEGYYKNKCVLITGGGGSIGSELVRQIAHFNPSKLVLFDVYENGVYDLHQELVLDKKVNTKVCVEIGTITDKLVLEQLFDAHKPNIVIHAAAHKHVPLMEHNWQEAINNNIFGTKNLIDIAEKFKIDKFMMVSTDKAVNPTNIMGATKRFCEMMIIDASKKANVCYGATRFGNVLGSAGSVVPLFKRQIANGGPITITDKRIIRYFMTIPEASNLVLNATAMSQNGELFVLDMGQQVEIYELAKKLIKLSGVPDIEIVETGLRDGEKLYEEILIDKEKHIKTNNKLIFIEKNPCGNMDCNIDQFLLSLKEACENNDRQQAKKILKMAIPEYKDPKEVNKKAEQKLNEYKYKTYEI